MDAEREEVVRQLAEDVAATLGEAHREAVQDEIASALEFTDTVEDFAQRLVDNVQQLFHDTFADTTWPACPRHPNHPLWFRGGAWWCEADGVAVARLGGAAPVTDPAAATVAIVVDPDYGERLEELAPRMPVWIAQTKGNSVAIKRLFRRLRREGGGSLASFVVDPEASRDHWCASVLETVDEHHGPCSQDPPYRGIEVIGTPLSPALRAFCEELGFHSFRDTASGFTARAPVPDA